MSRSEEEARNLAIATEMYNTVIVPFDSAHLDRFFPSDYIQHSNLADDGREGLKTFLDEAKTRFPNAKIEIRRAFADGPYVIFHVWGRLEEGGPASAIVDIFRLEGGLIREHWEVIQEIPGAVQHGNGPF